MIEKVIFNILAFVIFIITFWKLIKRNDTVYIYILVIEFIGIATRFISILNSIELSKFTVILLYIISIIIPGIMIFLERKKIFFSEIVCIISANISLKQGKNDIARRKIIKLINKYPNSYYARRLLAKIYEKEGKDEDAIDEYVRVIEINPKDYDSYYQIAFLLNNNEKQLEAEEMLLDLLKKKPEYYKASELLGDILYDQGNFKRAISVYLEALKYNPTRYELYYSLGMNYTRLNDFQTAMKYYEKAAAINSALYHAKFNIAQITLIMGELDEAESKFIDCMQDKDSEPDACYYLSIIFLLKGDEDRAVSYANIAVELDYKYYDKICKQEIFNPIMEFIRKPDGKKRHKYHLTYQELITKEHLDDTFCLIDKMKNNNDIQKNSESSQNSKIQNKDLDNERYRE